MGRVKQRGSTPIQRLRLQLQADICKSYNRSDIFRAPSWSRSQVSTKQYGTIPILILRLRISSTGFECLKEMTWSKRPPFHQGSQQRSRICSLSMI